MKILELFQPLLEYSRDITLQKMAKQLQGISATTELDPADVLAQLEAIDPTKNKQYVPWLVKQLAANQFRLEDRPRINKLLTDFLSIKNRLPQEQRDLGRLTLHQLDDIVDQAMSVDLATDKQQAPATGTFPVVPGSKVLYNGPLGQLAIPETEEASCELGRGTKWCTAAQEDNMFSHYSKEAPLYVWRDKNGEKYQFHFGEEAQLMDSRDRPLSKGQIAAFRKHPVLSKMFKMAETAVIAEPASAASYAATVIHGRWPEAEPVIMKNAWAILAYAEKVLEGRWPEAEEYIKTDPGMATQYAVSVIEDRWPEAEEYIKTDPYTAASYASSLLGEPWPEAEPVIMTEPGAAASYARNTLRRPWPEAEPVIMQSPASAAFYATHVLKRRWPEAEPVIKRNSREWFKYKREFNIV